MHQAVANSNDIFGQTTVIRATVVRYSDVQQISKYYIFKSDKITLLEIKIYQKNCQQKDMPLTLKQISRCIIHQSVVLFRSSVERSMHQCTHQYDASVKSTDK